MVVKIKKKIIETDEAVTLILDAKFEYKSGQFITLISRIDGAEKRRSYSLSSCPTYDQLPSITVKKIPNGIVSSFLVDQINEGDSLEILSPTGNFIVKDNESVNQRNVFLIGAGSGITPLISIIKYVLQTEPNSKIFLIYGNRDENSIILFHQLDQLLSKYSERFTIKYQFSQPLHFVKDSGRLSSEKIFQLMNDFQSDYPMSQSLFFICGPSGMMINAMRALKKLNVDEKKIFHESFLKDPKPAPELIPASVLPNSKEKVIDRKVSIKYRSVTYEIEVPSNKTILQAAIDQGVKLPYSCQNGVCSACMGKCVNGNVKLHEPEGLSSKDIENGYVLTCVAQPLSEGVEIEIE